MNNVRPTQRTASQVLPRPLWGEADTRPRVVGEGPNFPRFRKCAAQQTIAPHKCPSPHLNPLPSWGDGIGAERDRDRPVCSDTPVPSFHPGKGVRGIGHRDPPAFSGPPSHNGKGLGVRFFGATLSLISMLLLTASCAQVHEQMFTIDCAIGRPPLPGELAPGTAIALDVSTSPIPLLFPPHRAIARCDSAGVVTMNVETPVDTGLSQLSTPLSTAASHVTYVP